MSRIGANLGKLHLNGFFLQAATQLASAVRVPEGVDEIDAQSFLAFVVEQRIDLNVYETLLDPASGLAEHEPLLYFLVLYSYILHHYTTHGAIAAIRGYFDNIRRSDRFNKYVQQTLSHNDTVPSGFRAQFASMLEQEERGRRNHVMSGMVSLAELTPGDAWSYILIGELRGHVNVDNMTTTDMLTAAGRMRMQTDSGSKRTKPAAPSNMSPAGQPFQPAAAAAPQPFVLPGNPHSIFSAPQPPVPHAQPQPTTAATGPPPPSSSSKNNPSFASTATQTPTSLPEIKREVDEIERMRQGIHDQAAEARDIFTQAGVTMNDIRAIGATVAQTAQQTQAIGAHVTQAAQQAQASEQDINDILVDVEMKMDEAHDAQVQIENNIRGIRGVIGRIQHVVDIAGDGAANAEEFERLAGSLQRFRELYTDLIRVIQNGNPNVNVDTELQHFFDVIEDIRALDEQAQELHATVDNTRGARQSDAQGLLDQVDVRIRDARNYVDEIFGDIEKKMNGVEKEIRDFRAAQSPDDASIAATVVESDDDTADPFLTRTSSRAPPLRTPASPGVSSRRAASPSRRPGPPLMPGAKRVPLPSTASDDEMSVGSLVSDDGRGRRGSGSGYDSAATASMSGVSTGTGGRRAKPKFVTQLEADLTRELKAEKTDKKQKLALANNEIKKLKADIANGGTPDEVRRLQDKLAAKTAKHDNDKRKLKHDADLKEDQLQREINDLKKKLKDEKENAKDKLADLKRAAEKDCEEELAALRRKLDEAKHGLKEMKATVKDTAKAAKKKAEEDCVDKMMVLRNENRDLKEKHKRDKELLRGKQEAKSDGHGTPDDEDCEELKKENERLRLELAMLKKDLECEEDWKKIAADRAEEIDRLNKILQDAEVAMKVKKESFGLTADDFTQLRKKKDDEFDEMRAAMLEEQDELRKARQDAEFKVRTMEMMQQEYVSRMTESSGGGGGGKMNLSVLRGPLESIRAELNALAEATKGNRSGIRKLGDLSAKMTDEVIENMQRLQTNVVDKLDKARTETNNGFQKLSKGFVGGGGGGSALAIRNDRSMSGYGMHDAIMANPQFLKWFEMISLATYSQRRSGLPSVRLIECTNCANFPQVVEQELLSRSAVRTTACRNHQLELDAAIGQYEEMRVVFPDCTKTFVSYHKDAEAFRRSLLSNRGPDIQSLFRFRNLPRNTRRALLPLPGGGNNSDSDSESDHGGSAGAPIPRGPTLPPASPPVSPPTSPTLPAGDDDPAIVVDPLALNPDDAAPLPPVPDAADDAAPLPPAPLPPAPLPAADEIPLAADQPAPAPPAPAPPAPVIPAPAPPLIHAPVDTHLLDRVEARMRGAAANLEDVAQGVRRITTGIQGQVDALPGALRGEANTLTQELVRTVTGELRGGVNGITEDVRGQVNNAVGDIHEAAEDVRVLVERVREGVNRGTAQLDHQAHLATENLHHAARGTRIVNQEVHESAQEVRNVAEEVHAATQALLAAAAELRAAARQAPAPDLPPARDHPPPPPPARQLPHQPPQHRLLQDEAPQHQDPPPQHQPRAQPQARDSDEESDAFLSLHGGSDDDDDGGGDPRDGGGGAVLQEEEEEDEHQWEDAAEPGVYITPLDALAEDHDLFMRGLAYGAVDTLFNITAPNWTVYHELTPNQEAGFQLNLEDAIEQFANLIIDELQREDPVVVLESYPAYPDEDGRYRRHHPNHAFAEGEREAREHAQQVGEEMRRMEEIVRFFASYGVDLGPNPTRADVEFIVRNLYERGVLRELRGLEDGDMNAPLRTPAHNRIVESENALYDLAHAPEVQQGAFLPPPALLDNPDQTRTLRRTFERLLNPTGPTLMELLTGRRAQPVPPPQEFTIAPPPPQEFAIAPIPPLQLTDTPPLQVVEAPPQTFRQQVTRAVKRAVHDLAAATKAYALYRQPEEEEQVVVREAEGSTMQFEEEKQTEPPQEKKRAVRPVKKEPVWQEGVSSAQEVLIKDCGNRLRREMDGVVKVVQSISSYIRGRANTTPGFVSSDDEQHVMRDFLHDSYKIRDTLHDLVYRWEENQRMNPRTVNQIVSQYEQYVEQIDEWKTIYAAKLMNMLHGVPPKEEVVVEEGNLTAAYAAFAVTELQAANRQMANIVAEKAEEEAEKEIEKARVAEEERQQKVAEADETLKKLTARLDAEEAEERKAALTERIAQEERHKKTLRKASREARRQAKAEADELRTAEAKRVRDEEKRRRDAEEEAVQRRLAAEEDAVRQAAEEDAARARNAERERQLMERQRTAEQINRLGQQFADSDQRQRALLEAKKLNLEEQRRLEAIVQEEKAVILQLQQDREERQRQREDAEIAEAARLAQAEHDRIHAENMIRRKELAESMVRGVGNVVGAFGQALRATAQVAGTTAHVAGTAAAASAQAVGGVVGAVGGAAQAVGDAVGAVGGAAHASVQAVGDAANAVGGVVRATKQAVINTKAAVEARQRANAEQAARDLEKAKEESKRRIAAARQEVDVAAQRYLAEVQNPLSGDLVNSETTDIRREFGRANAKIDELKTAADLVQYEKYVMKERLPKYLSLMASVAGEDVHTNALNRELDRYDAEFNEALERARPIIGGVPSSDFEEEMSQAEGNIRIRREEIMDRNRASHGRIPVAQLVRPMRDEVGRAVNSIQRQVTNYAGALDETNVADQERVDRVIESNVNQIANELRSQYRRNKREVIHSCLESLIKLREGMWNVANQRMIYAFHRQGKKFPKLPAADDFIPRMNGRSYAAIRSEVNEVLGHWRDQRGQEPDPNLLLRTAQMVFLMRNQIETLLDENQDLNRRIDEIHDLALANALQEYPHNLSTAVGFAKTFEETKTDHFAKSWLRSPTEPERQQHQRDMYAAETLMEEYYAHAQRELMDALEPGVDHATAEYVKWDEEFSQILVDEYMAAWKSERTLLSKKRKGPRRVGNVVEERMDIEEG